MLPVAGIPNPGRDVGGEFVRGFLQLQIEDARDGVGAVLGGGPVPQHFHLINGGGGYGVEVGPGGPLPDRFECINQGAFVTTLAVDQHEQLVGGEAAQRRRIDELRRVGRRLAVGLERRRGVAQQLIEVRLGGGVDEVVDRKRVDGDGRLQGRSALTPRPDDHHFSERGLRLEPKRGGGGFTGSNLDLPLQGFVSDKARLHGQITGGGSQIEASFCIRSGTALGPDHLYVGPRERLPRLCVNDAALEGPHILCVNRIRAEGEQQSTRQHESSDLTPRDASGVREDSCQHRKG